jgi:hypothetical protein
MGTRVRTHPAIDFELGLLLAHATGDDGKQVFRMILDILERVMKRV